MTHTISRGLIASKATRQFICVLSIISVLALAFGPAVARSNHTRTRAAVGTSDAVVLEWIEIARTRIPAGPAPANPFGAARQMAMVQVAVFEAVNAITGKYQPYLGTVSAPAGASPEAAAIIAAHDTLVALLPAQTAALEGLSEASLNKILDGQAKEDGKVVGADAAKAILNNRTGDGSASPAPYIPENSDPYEWQPYAGCPTFDHDRNPDTAPVPGGALFHWQNVRPFGIDSSSQFRSEPPPALDSGVYAQDLNEVQTVGAANADSTARPQDRADVARFYGAVAAHYAWNSTLKQIAETRDDEITDTARTAALMNMAISDALVSAIETKYQYRTWRPLTAIARADEDGNMWTTPGAFTPYISTPCFPSYPSAHGSAAGAAEATLRRAYGRFGHSIVSTHPNVPGVTLYYTDLSDISADIADARVYGGIHFRYDQDAGQRQGHDVGQFVYNNNLQKLGDD